jgi:hypothetical protein
MNKGFILAYYAAEVVKRLDIGGRMPYFFLDLTKARLNGVIGCGA